MGIEVLETRRQFLDDMSRIDTMIGEKYCIYSEPPALITAQTRRASFAPYDPDGVEVLGIFYHLTAPLSEGE
jgi:hypothetical protein